MADDTKPGARTRKRPSALLLIAGLFALAVSVWAIVGPDTWSGSSNFPFGWVVVIGAIVVGAAMVRKRS